MSNKFGQFLADDEQPKASHKQAITPTRLSSVASGNDVSIKIKTSTLNRLKLLKTIEGHRSYAEVVEYLLEDYIASAGKDLQDKLDLLKG